MFQVLAAGATQIAREGSLYPLVPLPLGPLLDALPTEKRNEFFDRWMAPISYGDESSNDGTIVGRANDGQTFQAGILFRIGPKVLAPAQKAYLDIEVGLPWAGNSHPETWHEGEREALWTALFRCMDALIENARSGKEAPKRISQRVPVQPPPRKALQSFDIILDSSDDKESFPQKASVRVLQDTPFGLLDLQEPLSVAQGPVLDITDGNGTLLPDAAARTLFAMTYPDNPIEREEHLTAIADASLSGATKGLDVEEVLQKRPFLQTLADRAAKSGLGGSVAGDMLLFLLNAAERDPKNASVLKALHIIKADYKDGHDHAGQPLPSGRSTLMEAWSKFKPVAHLWAAFRLWQGDLKQDPSFALLLENADNGENFLNFLSVAEALREKAERFVAQGQKGPILSPDETWRAPSDLTLKPVQLGIPDLTDWAKERLSEYRAK